MNSRNPNRCLRSQHGFSLTELMVVVAIILMISAVAIPNVIRGMRHLRLRSAASSIVGLLQQARQRAVQDNRNYQVLLDPAVPGMAVPVLFVDLNYDGVYQNREPMFPLPTDVVVAPGSPAANNKLERAMSPGAPLGQQKLIISISRPTAPTFNPRGRACEPVIPAGVQPIATCNTIAGGANQVAYGIYLQSTTLPIDGWAAVSISPGGRIKRWGYDDVNKDWQ